MSELWRRVPGYPAYEVSRDGRVRSWKKRGGRYGKEVAQKDHNGYRQVELWTDRGDGRQGEWRMVHRLVMRAFISPCPDGFVVNHKDCDRSNNRLENLEYVTPKENYEHQVSVGSRGSAAPGEANGRSVLTREQVVEIRCRYAKSDVTQAELADEFGVCSVQISSIVRGETWENVGGPRLKVGVARGEATGNAKLTVAQVRRMRRLYEAGDVSYADLSEEFGIGKSHVGHIIRRDIWKHAGG